MPRFHSFRARLFILFLGLIGLLILTLSLAVNQAIRIGAIQQIDENLQVGEKVLARYLQERTGHLSEYARLLTSDFAFKQMVFEDDRHTLESALVNLRDRIGADRVALVSLDYLLVADSDLSGEGDSDYPHPDLLDIAGEEGSATGLVVVDGEPRQTVITPILAPVPVAWLAVDFIIDQEMADELKSITRNEVSLLTVRGERREMIATTFPAGSRATIERMPPDADMVSVLGSEYLTHSVVAIPGDPVSVTAVLQRSLDEGLQPFYRLRQQLAWISLLSALLAMVGSHLVGATISQPVTELNRGVKEIEQGNYDHRVEITQEDELGSLADSFNAMTLGLKERDKARNLLGKVMSPSIAHELMNSEITLGGEEREVTAFFSDIVGFTSISEKLTPSNLVVLLNEYFTHMADIIYERDGVIDKFIGDAIVSFWGAPLPCDDQRRVAVTTALLAQKRLSMLREKWKGEGKDQIAMRIGLNTGLAVVGNIGSKERMDYTVIGDAVNLAARLEGANKQYGTEIMLSEFTREGLGDDFFLRELDIVRVQGKREPVRIYEVIDFASEADDDHRSLRDRFALAVDEYRRGRFEVAADQFAAIDKETPGGDKASLLYQSRIEHLMIDPPGPDWEPIHDLPK